MSTAQDARLNYRAVRHMSSDVDAEFNAMTDFVVGWQKTSADGASNTVSTNQAILSNSPLRFDVIAATWVQHTTTTLNATSFATLTLRKNNGQDTGAGSTMTAVAAKSTQSNTITARKEFALTVTTSARRVTTGQALWLNIGKTSAGKKVGAGVLTVHCRRV